MTVRVCEAMTAIDGRGTDSVGLYDELAPVSDFVLSRRYDHDSMATFVGERAPDGATAVAVGGCGSGRLLERIARRYPTAVGLSRNRPMLELAAGRTDAPLVVADPRTVVAPTAFDVLTLLGNTLGHVGGEDEDGLAAVFESAHDRLRPGGLFVCDFVHSTTLVDGHVTEDAFESDRYRVERTVVVDREGVTGTSVDGRFTYAFTIFDREWGKTVRVGTSVPIRAFHPGTVLDGALDAGFTDATCVDPPTPHRGGLVARRPG